MGGYHLLELNGKSFFIVVGNSTRISISWYLSISEKFYWSDAVFVDARLGEILTLTDGTPGTKLPNYSMGRLWGFPSLGVAISSMASGYWIPVVDDRNITGIEGDSKKIRFRKWGYPQILHFTGIFPYKPTIWGYHHFQETPMFISWRSGDLLSLEAPWKGSIEHRRLKILKELFPKWHVIKSSHTLW